MSPCEPRILVLSAGFGEGHNSAAQALVEYARSFAASSGLSIEAQVYDPCAKAQPLTNQALSRLYKFTLRNLPMVWHAIYESTDRIKLDKSSLRWLAASQLDLLKKIRSFAPTHIISTYPLYPYFLSRIFASYPKLRVPSHVVITDSITINSTWTRLQADMWHVTDATTRALLIARKIPRERIHVSGFPIKSAFIRTAAGVDWQAGQFRVLYFATQRKPMVARTATAILQAKTNIRLTIVLGRHNRSMLKKALAIKQKYQERVQIIGWTKRVAELMSNAHLVVGKAGGATVHEAIAATCPMLVNHVVPGQEEGNIRYLQQLGGGFLAEDAYDLTQALQALLADNGWQWKQLKQALLQLEPNNASPAIIGAVLDKLLQQTANAPLDKIP